jgi:hypothetical protein
MTIEKNNTALVYHKDPLYPCVLSKKWFPSIISKVVKVKMMLSKIAIKNYLKIIKSGFYCLRKIYK